MVHKIILAAAFIAISFSAQAQKLNEKELMGSWHMVIDIDAAIKESQKDLNLFEKMIVGSVSGFVDQVLEMVDITIVFMPKGKAVLTVDGPEVQEKETTQLTWQHDPSGGIIIDDYESDQAQVDFDSIWRLEGDRLQSYEPDGTLEKHVYMIRKEK
ncbi:MAG: hypothetical protein O3B88_00995 [Bacteroidetes bacterium]|jgi:hypothetical protein|nr:hypothetical protein [Flavobacteriaceae bacterium]MDA0718566.1 hypothetical protein [Bacteroidota bacterium]MDA0863227.1 hypothetical protein [Bacteroidota bacterium]